MSFERTINLTIINLSSLVNLKITAAKNIHKPLPFRTRVRIHPSRRHTRVTHMYQTCSLQSGIVSRNQSRIQDLVGFRNKIDVLEQSHSYNYADDHLQRHKGTCDCIFFNKDSSLENSFYQKQSRQKPRLQCYQLFLSLALSKVAPIVLPIFWCLRMFW